MNSKMAIGDLCLTFETNAIAAAAIVEHVGPDKRALREAVQRITQDLPAIVLGPEEFLPAGVMDDLRDLPGVIQNPTDKQLSTASCGITSAFAGVASSGSVCVALGQPLAGAASLLMPLHIVLLEAARIVARPSDLFHRDCFAGEGLRRDFVLITGPSATADMGPLVRGVHGPHRLHILLIG
jgi:L-lactate dehydrogenase complex protein LldG